MRAITEQHLKIAYIAIVAGILIGVIGAVRTGAIVIALGTGVIALSQWGKRKMESYLPLAIAISLLAVAVALPKGL
jgi:hypothetical protein